MNYIRFILLLVIACPLKTCADALDSLREQLSTPLPVQEKVYLHLDNTCYFAGDTIWYKAYVTRADDLRPTDISRLLYVELISAEGYVMERQHVIVNGYGEACGQFALSDTIYSGYYELRAYTVWQLNFNTSQRKYDRRNTDYFYSRELQREFYTDYHGLYSRVIPIYEKPADAGMEKIMVPAPKRRAAKPKPGIAVNFYPEGGSLVCGLESRLAFEVTDKYGRPLDISGTTEGGARLVASFDGRGVISYTPGGATEEVTFGYEGKDYTFKLPESSESGCVLCYDFRKNTITVKSKGLYIAALSASCRGRNVAFLRTAPCTEYSLSVDSLHLPTGVSEVVVYDREARPVASRLLFVDNHDIGKPLDIIMTRGEGDTVGNESINPYTRLGITATFPREFRGGCSISVRDTKTDSPSYDDGNMLTELLLSGDLKGFVAHPAYYFESDDDEHKSRLDMLLMIQGWRKYTAPARIRFAPEKTTVFYGKLHKILDSYDVINEKGGSQQIIDRPIFSSNHVDFKREDLLPGIEKFDETQDADEESDKEQFQMEDRNLFEEIRKDGKVKKKVLVEAEFEKAGESAGVITPTDKYGYFDFQIPPYYGDGILFVTAYNQKDSARKTLLDLKDVDFFNASSYPKYYIQRILPFPVFTSPYSWYQTHVPHPEYSDSLIETTGNGMWYGFNKTNTLAEIKVRARRRRSLRDFNLTRPVLDLDVYDLYNLVTDRGLSFGVFEAGNFPRQASTCLFGNMGKNSDKKVKAYIGDICFYKDYMVSGMPTETNRKNITWSELVKKLQLKRLNRVKIYTDYNMRDGSNNDSGNSNEPDVLLLFSNVSDDGIRPAYSVRRYILDGIDQPEKFYSPDYSGLIPSEPKDYRRTLYWNPNVRPGKDGKFHDFFYSGSRDCKVKITASGISSDGKIYDK